MTVEEILTSLGVPFKRDSWAPQGTPKDAKFYATIEYDFRDGGADEVVMFRWVAPTICFFDYGNTAGREMRERIHEALSDANFKHSMTDAFFYSDPNVFMTYFDIDPYIEKRGF